MVFLNSVRCRDDLYEEHVGRASEHAHDAVNPCHFRDRAFWKVLSVLSKKRRTLEAKQA